MPDPGEKKEAKLRQYKKTVKDYKKENFREKEKKSLTKSIGTAGPKVRPDGTVKDDKPTAAQKEAFRQQEETYLTKSPGTVGDKYYKNPEGTGTGQGGSGIPKAISKQTSSTVKSTTAPVTRPPEVTYVYIDPPTSDDNEEVQSLKNLVDTPPETSSYITEPNRLLYGSLSDDRLNVAQTSFFNLAEDLATSSAPTASFSFRPTSRGSLFSNNFRLTGAEVEASFPLINKGRSLFGGDT
jgi:hypothetical protein